VLLGLSFGFMDLSRAAGRRRVQLKGEAQTITKRANVNPLGWPYLPTDIIVAVSSDRDGRIFRQISPYLPTDIAVSSDR